MDNKTEQFKKAVREAKEAIWKTFCKNLSDTTLSQFSGNYGNTKITSMHLYSRRRNVAAQVVEELKMVTYATLPMEERR